MNPPTEFERQLTELLNRHQSENLSSTPTDILARYISAALKAFHAAVLRRDAWYMFRPLPHSAHPSEGE